MLNELRKEQEQVIDVYETLLDLESAILQSLDKIKSDIMNIDENFDIETIDTIRTKLYQLKLKDKNTFYKIEFFLEMLIIDIFDTSNLRLFLFYLKEKYPHILNEKDLIFKYFLDFIEGETYGIIFVKLLYDFFKMKDKKNLVRYLLSNNLMRSEIMKNNSDEIFFN